MCLYESRFLTSPSKLFIIVLHPIALQTSGKVLLALTQAGLQRWGDGMSIHCTHVSMQLSNTVNIAAAVLSGIVAV